LPGDNPKDYEIGYGKPPIASRFKPGNRANPQGRPRGSGTLAGLLQRALDAPAAITNGKRRRLTKREAMIRSLVERSAGADLAATKLLFEMLRKADPQAVAPDPAESAPLGKDALTLLKERLGRIAQAQLANPSPAATPDATTPRLEPPPVNGMAVAADSPGGTAVGEPERRPKDE
jgi:hypothetical protein